MLGMYLATKKFNANFSISLMYELANQGDNAIDVLTAAPAWVETEMTKDIKKK
jgi:short-subunit dehydrogenase